jgi:hypothetical protein
MASHVVELAFSHERSFERQRKTISVSALFANAIGTVSVGFVRRVLHSIMRRQTTYLNDQAVWFRGAAREVDERARTESIDPQFKLIDKLRQMEGHLSEARAALLSRKSEHPSTREVHQQLLAAAASLYEAVREMRAAIQAFEADRCALEASGQSAANSVDELNQALDRLQSAT